MEKPPVGVEVTLYKSFTDYADFDDRVWSEVKCRGSWDGEKFVDTKGRKINPDGWRAS